MKLSQCMEYINTALNYPAINYTDVHIYFDMAISELNTTLHTRIPTVSVMVEEYKESVTRFEEDKIILTTDPATNNYVIPTVPGDYDDEADALANNVLCFFDSNERKFYILNVYSREYSGFRHVKGVYVNNGNVKVYTGVNFGNEALWMESRLEDTYECVLDNYLPDDWVLLWLIPYVCYKYTVRDGGTAQVFADELTQGFQQLQETYDVPNKVKLATYADKIVYRDLVEDYMPNLNIMVNTRAIFEDMKHSRNTNAIYGSFYDRGGF